MHVTHHFWSLIEEKTPLAAFAGMDVPTLILRGTRSPRPSRTITRLLAETLPRARHRTIRDASHMSPITHSAEVNALILEHLLANETQTDMRQPAFIAGDLPAAGRAFSMA